MTEIRVGVVDVHVIHETADGMWRVLLLRRSDQTRCPGAWETVHGRVEQAEHPVNAAIRELKEETGLEASRLYNVTVQHFYLHGSDTIQVAIVFVAFVESEAVILGEEHRACEWLDTASALERFAWPRDAAALRDIVALHEVVDGSLEDVRRIF